MIFLELILQNFGPYLGRQVINLQPNTEDSRPVILFGGMNGGGKTTLIDAIRLAFYGHRAQCSTRGNLAYGDFLIQSVNRHTPRGEETSVELAFEQIIDNKTAIIRVKRTWTANPRITKDNLGVLFEDWPDDSLVQTWDEYIENILPLGISNLFLFDGEQVKELAELETPPPVVIEAIQSLLGLELAERLRVDLDILVNRKRKALADANTFANLAAIEEKINNQRKESKIAKQDLAAKQKDLQSAQENEKQAFDKFRNEGGKIAGERSQLERQLQNAIADCESQRQTLAELAAGNLPLALILSLLQQTQTQAQKEHRASQISIAKEVLEERDRHLLTYLNSIKLKPQQIAEIQSFLDQENQTLEAVEGETAWLNPDTETVNLLNTILDYQLTAQKSITQDQLIKLKHREEEINSIERQLAIAAPPEVYEQLKDTLELARNKTLEAKFAYEKSQKHCDDIANQIEKTKKELSRYSEQTIDIKNDEHIINSTAKVQATLKLFKEKLTLRKLNQLESVVTECFLYLLHKSDLVHRVAIDTHTFSLTLYDLQGQFVPKHRLSAGEKQLLAIAFLWGLARVSNRHLPIAIDTPLGRLDSSHRTNLVERYFPATSHQVILLSTDTEIGEIEVKKLREQEAIAREYLLKYNSEDHRTIIEDGYFW